MKKSIFVQIPSYRDWELANTIQDCLQKSSGNNKIVFGVHNCIFSKDKIPLDFGKAKVSYIESISPNNVGVLKSRKLANSLYSGEDYYLQIDAHMRFVKDWDEILINDHNYYKTLGIKKPLLTQYPGNFQYDNPPNYKNPPYFQTCVVFCQFPNQFTETLIPSQTAETAKPQCGFHYSISGAFVFTDGNYSKIVPNDKIVFWGEELLTAARSFTHGYDIVIPRKFIVWHLYASGRPFEHIKRHHAWQDFPELWQEMDAVSKAEYMSIFTERRISDDALGTERTLEEFEEFTGLNFADRTIKCWLHENHAAP